MLYLNKLTGEIYQPNKNTFKKLRAFLYFHKTYKETKLKDIKKYM